MASLPPSPPRLLLTGQPWQKDLLYFQSFDGPAPRGERTELGREARRWGQGPCTGHRLLRAWRDKARQAGCSRASRDRRGSQQPASCGEVAALRASWAVKGANELSPSGLEGCPWEWTAVPFGGEQSAALPLELMGPGPADHLQVHDLEALMSEISPSWA